MSKLSRVAAAGIITLALCGLDFAQTPQSFDVPAIRPDKNGASSGTGFDFNGTNLRITNATLQYLIRSAYHIQGDQIADGPAWLDSDRYDIEAKTGALKKSPLRCSEPCCKTCSRFALD